LARGIAPTTRRRTVATAFQWRSSQSRRRAPAGQAGVHEERGTPHTRLDTESKRLITRKSQVQILPPLPREAPETGPLPY
jgi:hypothetical protein